MLHLSCFIFFLQVTWEGSCSFYIVSAEASFNLSFRSKKKLRLVVLQLFFVEVHLVWPEREKCRWNLARLNLHLRRNSDEGRTLKVFSFNFSVFLGLDLLRLVTLPGKRRNYSNHLEFCLHQEKYLETINFTWK